MLNRKALKEARPRLGPAHMPGRLKRMDFDFFEKKLAAAETAITMSQ